MNGHRGKLPVRFPQRGVLPCQNACTPSLTHLNVEVEEILFAHHTEQVEFTLALLQVDPSSDGTGKDGQVFGSVTLLPQNVGGAPCQYATVLFNTHVSLDDCVALVEHQI